MLLQGCSPVIIFRIPKLGSYIYPEFCHKATLDCQTISYVMGHSLQAEYTSHCEADEL